MVLGRRPEALLSQALSQRQYALRRRKVPETIFPTIDFSASPMSSFLQSSHMERLEDKIRRLIYFQIPGI